MIRPPIIIRAEEGDGGSSGGAAVAAPPESGGNTLIADAPAPAATETESTWTWADESGKFSTGWQAKLPDELKTNPSLAAIGSISDLAKSYAYTKSLVGKRLEAPGEDATPEAVAEWRKVVGAPASADEYGNLRPETIPEAMWDKEGEKAFRGLALKHNLTPSAVKAIVGHYAGEIAQGIEQTAEAEKQFLASEGESLRKAWGTDYDANLSLASRVAKTVGLDPQAHPIFQSAEVVQAFAKLGKLFSEDKLVTGESAGINGAIGSRISDITDPKSQSQLAREYRGEFGLERQAAAQSQYHQLLAARKAGS